MMAISWCRGAPRLRAAPGRLTALASAPGSGNTWLRYLLQQLTGQTLPFSSWQVRHCHSALTGQTVPVSSDRSDIASQLWESSSRRAGILYNACIAAWDNLRIFLGAKWCIHISGLAELPPTQHLGHVSGDNKNICKYCENPFKNS